MTEHKLKERIERGDVLVGTLHDFEDPNLIELVARCGVDFMVVCVEHGLKDEARLVHLVRAAEGVGVPILLRVGRGETDNLERFLDVGFAGFLVAHITDRERAEKVASWCYYPPLGGRGAGFTRGWISQLGEEELARKMRANDELVLIGIIEDPEGVDNIDEIVQVPGFTGFVAGTGDLALAMGEETHVAPPVIEALGKVTGAVTASGSRALMAFCPGPERVQPLRDLGATMLLLHHDTHIILGAYQSLLGKIRAEL